MVSEQYKAYLKTDRGKTAQKAKIEHLERGKKQAKSKSSKKRIQKKIDEEKRLKKEVTPITPKSYIVDGKKVSKAQYEQSVIDKSKKLKEGEELVAKTTRYERQYQKQEEKESIRGVNVEKEQPRTWQDYYDKEIKLKKLQEKKDLFETKQKEIEQKFFETKTVSPIIKPGEESNVSFVPVTTKVFKGDKKKYAKAKEELKSLEQDYYSTMYPGMKDWKPNIKSFDSNKSDVSSIVLKETSIKSKPIEKYIGVKVTKDNVDEISKALKKTNIEGYRTKTARGNHCWPRFRLPSLPP